MWTVLYRNGDSIYLKKRFWFKENAVRYISMLGDTVPPIPYEPRDITEIAQTNQRLRLWGCNVQISNKDLK